MDAEIEQLKGEIANLMARISLAEAQIAAMDDDIPEPDLRNADGGESAATWSGRIMSHDGELIAEWDVTDPENITGEYILYDGVAQTAEFASEPDDTSLCWKVANAPVSPSTIYTLSDETQGDIVLPVPKAWEDLQVFLTDEDGKLKFKDFLIKTEDPDVGLEFTKPDSQDDPDEPQLLQLKTTGGSAGDVYVCGDDGAASWQTPKIELNLVGTSGIQVKLILGDKEYPSEVLYGLECEV
jgi:hypothetical protein